MRALILAGHGSHILPDTAGIVWSYVDQLRRWGVADEITACFWKEMPAFNQVLNSIQSEHVTVVPVFTAAGYFSQTVIPAEMGLAGPITRSEGRTIYYTRTIGEHPAIAEIVQRHVTNTLQAENLNPHDVAVAIVGHGTPRNSQSQDTARDQAAHLHERALVAEVVTAYLDDDPKIASIYRTTKSPAIIVVPFFLATGSHVTQDVPQALGLMPGQSQATINGRQVYYTPPVGTDEAVCQIIIELARETGQRFEIQPGDNQWDSFPSYGSDDLMTAIKNNEMTRFGELQLSLTEVRPAHTKSDKIERMIDTPAALRQIVREKPFRPMATSTGLPGGWCVPVAAHRALPAVIETIYPGAIGDWARNQRGEFRALTLREVGERQTGIFRSIHKATATIIDRITNTVCGQCVRQPTWLVSETSLNDIPCQAPCNWWLSQAKEAI